MQKQWRLKAGGKDSGLERIFDEAAAVILKNRGIKSKDEAEEILLPDYGRHIHDPFLLKDMDQAVERILLAIEKSEKILIFGDYDADGVPASAVLAEFFKKIGYENFSVYIPHRHNEQYGMSVAAVEKFTTEGVKLIITVDCGISNFDEVKRAGELGVDVVVTDHHLPPKKLPKAIAIIDPKREDCRYPYKHLAGTGVAWKLVQALVRTGNYADISPAWEKWLLELVAIATVADMVPITGENKTMVKFGLMVLRMTRRPGLIELFRVLKIKREHITEDDIAFMVGPRLNSAGRMSHALEAYELLMTADSAVATKIASELEGRNKERRSQVAVILESVEQKVQTDETKLPAVIVVGNENWGLGVLGLAAARISEKYGRTVFVWSVNGSGEIKGSCRSDGQVNVVELMTLANKPKLFRDFGGHSFAGGFSLPKDKVAKLEKGLLLAYDKAKKTEIIEEEEADLKVSLSDIDWHLQKEVEKLGPYGMEFEKPVFWIEGVEIVASKSFGKEGGHVELQFKKESGETLCAIAFFACDGVLQSDQGHIWPGVNLAPGRRVDILVNIEKSTFGRRPELRLRIVDLRQSRG